MMESAGPTQPRLRRRLTLPLLVLYGLGVTIGAGIYVLVGATAGRAGVHAPSAFVVAAVVMALTAASFAELSGRYPVSAGEAAYVRAGFRSDLIAIFTGILVIAAGSVSSAAISIGSTGYIRELIDLPQAVLVPVVVLAMGLVAAWGILESVLFAALFTLVEAGGLIAIIVLGFGSDAGLVARLPEVLPPLFEPGVWSGIAAAGLLAFFAFIGFEDLVNVAEETRNPKKTMPWAIFLTLAISTVIYFLVASVAVLTVPIDQLAASSAPLNDVFREVTGASSRVILAIAVVATLNTIIVQIIMASRVVYGLADQGNLPAAFARINRFTRTPLVATAAVVTVILALAMAFPLEGLAEMTSRITLTVFALVNIALIKIKLAGEPAPDGVFEVRLWVPVAGVVTCVAFLMSGYLVG
ncbi:MAG: APC family permease [Hyphomicrobiales bacterium]